MGMMLELLTKEPGVPFATNENSECCISQIYYANKK
uniref:Uncharacterized protein n=1 Tax=Ciona intestinalis TaxID=7719 RepID=H2XSE2_CIOIN